MIDRVGNGNTYIPPYDRGGKKAARAVGDAPAFLLPGEEENGGVIWDRGPGDDIPRSAAHKGKEEKKDEYIPTKEEKGVEPEKEEEEEYRQSGFGRLIGRIGEAIKSFFLSLWYGGEEKKDTVNPTDAFSGSFDAGAAAEPGEEGETEDIQDPSGDNSRESRIRNAIVGNDTEALMKELTEDGKRHPARNTSLLTHYDKRGRIVKRDDSEVGRILSSDSGKRGKSGRNVERRPQGNYRRYI